MEASEEKVSVLREMFPYLAKSEIQRNLTLCGDQLDSAIELLLSLGDGRSVDESLVDDEDYEDDDDDEDFEALSTVGLRTTNLVPNTSKYSPSSTQTSQVRIVTTTSTSPPPSSSSSSTNYNSSSIASHPTDTDDILKNFEYLYAGGYNNHNELFGEIDHEQSVRDALRSSQQETDLELARRLQLEEDELSSVNLDTLLAESAVPPEPQAQQANNTYNYNNYNYGESYDYMRPANAAHLAVAPPPSMGGPMTRSWEDAEKLDKDLPKRYGVKINRTYITKVFKKRLKYLKMNLTVSIFNIIKPDFVHKFEAKRKEFQKKYGKWHPYSWPTMVYHSTKKE
eukprot:TRINITY_DN2880_c0_g1_i1.p1 TRINITY_DN2880_c0_g1~~TRINITY_DN2880_c0_g1_i1.p1  ORF type:complete len:339 (-),score=85.83 TRINITY_DN2880_c0_g1_i1:488-1504(-)